ncbi:CTP synthase [Helcococcus sueciensis]|uniref:CTP synthase n=1 Tax=Helcococcus sueciensis TaxID=241555 RepID=UPI00041A7A7E|nr:CTP synthase [Helcococcus sueciensis]
MSKFIFVTGGVVSGIGKGIVATSLGRLLKNRGLKVFLQKFDPYINVDPGTMSPYQHGEVFVTKDGAETDLDLGHYERFIDEELTQNANITTGRVYQSVISKERRGEYLGATVQVVPHITDEIKQKIYDAYTDSEADVIITEIGGTVGDIESLPFIEAVRQFHNEHDPDEVMIIHTALLPTIPGTDEIKTKPLQHSYKELMSLGLRPNMIVTRCNQKLTDEVKKKISLFCDVKTKSIIESPNVENIYELPLILNEQKFDEQVVNKLKLNTKDADMSKWIDMVQRLKNPKNNVKIALVGKYVQLHDAYLSVVEALKHGGIDYETSVDIEWINSEEIDESNVEALLSGCDGVVVPGGFGNRGIEGKIITAKYARENNLPYLGICLGMQIASIEFARTVLGLKDADSSEWNESSENPIISLMTDQYEVTNIGGTLRLGNYDCHIQEGTLAKSLYGEDVIVERHRHRYEFNNEYRERFEEFGFVFSGLSPDGKLVEIVELKDHPYYIASQFHPEFKSRPNRPHPLFKGLIKSSLDKKNSK